MYWSREITVGIAMLIVLLIPMVSHARSSLAQKATALHDALRQIPPVQYTDNPGVNFYLEAAQPLLAQFIYALEAVWNQSRYSEYSDQSWEQQPVLDFLAACFAMWRGALIQEFVYGARLLGLKDVDLVAIFFIKIGKDSLFSRLKDCNDEGYALEELISWILVLEGKSFNAKTYSWLKGEIAQIHRKAHEKELFLLIDKIFDRIEIRRTSKLRLG